MAIQVRRFLRLPWDFPGNCYELKPKQAITRYHFSNHGLHEWKLLAVDGNMATATEMRPYSFDHEGNLLSGQVSIYIGMRVRDEINEFGEGRRIWRWKKSEER